MTRRLCRGNDASVWGALVAGCQAFFGYPITPASEIAHEAARLFPHFGRTFIQAESEVAAINMVYGASSGGARCMTGSSGPGISLKAEGLSYIAAAELPCVIVDIMRVGPGLGNIYPDQGDYNQVVKGCGHGSYKNPVLAPNSVQEMFDFTIEAFDLADRYRTPVFVLADAYVGQMTESLELHDTPAPSIEKPWRIDATAETNSNLVTSIFLNADEMEAHVEHLQAKYRQIEKDVCRAESIETEDAEVVLVGYGVVSRILLAALRRGREQGLPIGLVRPQTLWPFPSEAIRQAVGDGRKVLVCELSDGQMLDDVRLALGSQHPIDFMYRYGGHVPSVDDVLQRVRSLLSPEKAGSAR